MQRIFALGVVLDQLPHGGERVVGPLHSGTARAATEHESSAHRAHATRRRARTLWKISEPRLTSSSSTSQWRSCAAIIAAVCPACARVGAAVKSQRVGGAACLQLGPARRSLGAARPTRSQPSFSAAPKASGRARTHVVDVVDELPDCLWPELADG
jgi:hypothetical protein